MRLLIIVLDVLSLFLLQPELTALLIGKQRLATLSMRIQQVGKAAFIVAGPAVMRFALVRRLRIKILSKPDFYRVLAQRQIIREWYETGLYQGKSIDELWQELEGLMGRSPELRWKETPHDDLKYLMEHALDFEKYPTVTNKLTSVLDWLIVTSVMVALPIAWVFLVAAAVTIIRTHWTPWLILGFLIFMVTYMTIGTLSNYSYLLQTPPKQRKKDIELLKDKQWPTNFLVPILRKNVDIFYLHYRLREYGKYLNSWCMRGSGVFSVLFVVGLLSDLHHTLIVIVAAPLIFFAAILTPFVLFAIPYSLLFAAALLVRLTEFLHLEAYPASRVLALMGIATFLVARLLSWWD